MCWRQQPQPVSAVESPGLLGGLSATRCVMELAVSSSQKSLINEGEVLAVSD